MTELTCPAAPAAEPPAASSGARNAAEVRERLNYLFRASLQDGRLHPLFHLIQQYRLGEQP
ncbi:MULTISPECIES: hypothetical protein [unclassified Rhizobacter]|uniref:hypothetical protein n=1 Tax=unclassified Rhizobacter TaxID=2640088 RepID=UPI0006FB38E5|nr:MULTISPECIES: hypothetical protein [unclassified Rhizobacter]KQU81640.1 hypothetical protein ASC88_01835 [Rhizobacter sp. Root29]KQW12031.1 hypothetical protein ASC98_19740 [Rhizobacter sp. Root1238]KRB13403.1 hypothetical protein ASE08_27850 [Rhizobacter sp. Root16D2]